VAIAECWVRLGKSSLGGRRGTDWLKWLKWLKFEQTDVSFSWKKEMSIGLVEFYVCDIARENESLLSVMQIFSKVFLILTPQQDVQGAPIHR
jgi:hypothetical protein